MTFTPDRFYYLRIRRARGQHATHTSTRGFFKSWGAFNAAPHSTQRRSPVWTNSTVASSMSFNNVPSSRMVGHFAVGCFWQGLVDREHREQMYVSPSSSKSNSRPPEPRRTARSKAWRNSLFPACFIIGKKNLCGVRCKKGDNKRSSASLPNPSGSINFPKGGLPSFSFLGRWGGDFSIRGRFDAKRSGTTGKR